MKATSFLFLAALFVSAIGCTDTRPFYRSVLQDKEVVVKLTEAIWLHGDTTCAITKLARQLDAERRADVRRPYSPVNADRMLWEEIHKVVIDNWYSSTDTMRAEVRRTLDLWLSPEKSSKAEVWVMPVTVHYRFDPDQVYLTKK